MDVASVVKSIQTFFPLPEVNMHFKTTAPQNHCNNISLKVFHAVTDWRCDHPGLLQSTHLFQVLANSSILFFVFCFCQNGVPLHRWPGCVLVFRHGQGLGGGHRCSNDEAMVINLSLGAPCVEPDVAWECKEWGPLSPAPLYILFKCLNIWLSESLRGTMGWLSSKAQIRAVNGWGEISETRWMCVMLPEVM